VIKDDFKISGNTPHFKEPLNKSNKANERTNEHFLKNKASIPLGTELPFSSLNMSDT